VERYQAAVFALLGRLLGAGRGALVEDLAQETFLAVFRRLAEFAPAGPARLSSWILTIASRRAIDELRRRGPGWATAVTAEDVAEAAGQPAAGASGDAALERKRLAAAIERALAELSPPYRAAFVLYELHGLEHAEIAAALEIDAGTVKSRLSRARAALRVSLAELHHER
jgi:RNA polymerase sigma-70 factor, ECF subfamily